MIRMSTANSEQGCLSQPNQASNTVSSPAELPGQNDDHQRMYTEIMRLKASQQKVKDSTKDIARKEKCTRLTDVAEELSLLYESNEITKAEFVDRLNAKYEELGYKEKMVHKAWTLFVGYVEKRFHKNNKSFDSELDKRIAAVHRKFEPNFCLFEASLNSQQSAQNSSSFASHITTSGSHQQPSRITTILEFMNPGEADDDEPPPHIREQHYDTTLPNGEIIVTEVLPENAELRDLNATLSNDTPAGNEEEQQSVESQKGKRKRDSSNLSELRAKRIFTKRKAPNSAEENPSPSIASSRKRRFASIPPPTATPATTKRTPSMKNQRDTKTTAASEEVTTPHNSTQNETGFRRTRHSDAFDPIAAALAEPVSIQNQLHSIRRQIANKNVTVKVQNLPPTRLQPSRTAKSNHGQVSSPQQQQSSPPADAPVPLGHKKRKPRATRDQQIHIPAHAPEGLIPGQQDTVAGNNTQHSQESSSADPPQAEQPIVKSQSEQQPQQTVATSTVNPPESFNPPAFFNQSLQSNAANSTGIGQQQSDLTRPLQLQRRFLANPPALQNAFQVQRSTSDIIQIRPVADPQQVNTTHILQAAAAIANRNLPPLQGLFDDANSPKNNSAAQLQQRQQHLAQNTPFRLQQPAATDATANPNPGGNLPLQVNDPQPPLPQLQQPAPDATANPNPDGVPNNQFQPPLQHVAPPFQQQQQPPIPPQFSIQDLFAQQAAIYLQQRPLPALPNQPLPTSAPTYFEFLQNLNAYQKEIFDIQSARNLELLRTTIDAANQAMGVNNNNGN